MKIRKPYFLRSAQRWDLPHCPYCDHAQVIHTWADTTAHLGFMEYRCRSCGGVVFSSWHVGVTRLHVTRPGAQK
jgi:transcription elongation factor Elf1